ncbi:MAG TPA: hypothetical protein VHA75_02015, partial [Rugosimonospora sp.]|nr:hypothetical protein [Rugosimonospora sp.]
DRLDGLRRERRSAVSQPDAVSRRLLAWVRTYVVDVGRALPQRHLSPAEPEENAAVQPPEYQQVAAPPSAYHFGIDDPSAPSWPVPTQGPSTEPDAWKRHLLVGAWPLPRPDELARWIQATGSLVTLTEPGTATAGEAAPGEAAGEVVVILRGFRPTGLWVNNTRTGTSLAYLTDPRLVAARQMQLAVAAASQRWASLANHPFALMLELERDSGVPDLPPGYTAEAQGSAGWGGHRRADTQARRGGGAAGVVDNIDLLLDVVESTGSNVRHLLLDEQHPDRPPEIERFWRAGLPGRYPSTFLQDQLIDAAEVLEWRLAGRIAVFRGELAPDGNTLLSGPTGLDAEAFLAQLPEEPDRRPRLVVLPDAVPPTEDGGGFIRDLARHTAVVVPVPAPNQATGLVGTAWRGWAPGWQRLHRFPSLAAAARALLALEVVRNVHEGTGTAGDLAAMRDFAERAGRDEMPATDTALISIHRSHLGAPPADQVELIQRLRELARTQRYVAPEMDVPERVDALSLRV